MHTHHRGFSAIEIILIIAVVGLVGAVGYLFMQSAQKQSNNHPTTTTSTADQETKTTTTNAPDKSSDARAMTNVQAFYKKYLAATDRPDQFATTQWVKDGYTTQAAADQRANAQAVDPVTCSQNPLPYDSYSFGTPSLSDTTGMLHVTGRYENGDAVMIMLTLVKDNGNWKINQFGCSM